MPTTWLSASIAEFGEFHPGAELDVVEYF